jgi:L-asparaginase
MIKLIIHGGAGAREGGHTVMAAYDASVRRIVASAFEVLRTQGARACVVEAVRQLEDDPIFNAGIGSRLQGDGKARLSAAIMDSEARSLAAVINVERVRNPIMFADEMSGQTHPIIGGELATQMARSLGYPEYDVVTDHRREEHARSLVGKTGTVGAVALDANGMICAGTSTGGVGNETPGRVSDAPTVAGTYTTRNVGISCTGAGEQIVNQAVAARIATRVDDGQSLAEAGNRTVRDGNLEGYRYGLIAIDRNGEHFTSETEGVTTVFAVTDGTTLQTFADVGDRD